MSKIREVFGKIAPQFSMVPFAIILGPYIDEVLDEQGLNKFRQGTILIPRLLIWFVLMLTIRRDLAYHKVFSWMISGFRWIKKMLPAKNKIVKDGTISKARIRLGVITVEALFYKLAASFVSLPKDFPRYQASRLTAQLPQCPIVPKMKKKLRNHLHAKVVQVSHKFA